MTGMLVSLTSAFKGRGELAAMKPGSQTAQPLHSEPPAPPRHARLPWCRWCHKPCDGACCAVWNEPGFQPGQIGGF